MNVTSHSPLQGCEVTHSDSKERRVCLKREAFCFLVSLSVSMSLCYFLVSTFLFFPCAFGLLLLCVSAFPRFFLSFSCQISWLCATSPSPLFPARLPVGYVLLAFPADQGGANGVPQRRSEAEFYGRPPDERQSRFGGTRRSRGRRRTWGIQQHGPGVFAASFSYGVPCRASRKENASHLRKVLDAVCMVCVGSDRVVSGCGVGCCSYMFALQLFV